ncbi:uncharacterized protein RCH25_016255 [Pelodytes ibericus]
MPCLRDRPLGASPPGYWILPPKIRELTALRTSSSHCPTPRPATLLPLLILHEVSPAGPQRCCGCAQRICSVESCRNRYVTGLLGGSVVLQLDETEITSATWEFCHEKRLYIADTYPGRPLKVRNRQYNGRVFSTPDGSLTISRLTMADQRIYNVDLFVKLEVYKCNQRYNLTIVKQLQGDPNVPSKYSDANFPCAPKDRAAGQVCRNRHVTGIEGETVTLQLGQTRLTSVTWEYCSGERDFIANTHPGKPLVVRDPLYNGRLTSTADGSLIITGLTIEDQRIYNADLFNGTWEYICDQRYVVTVIKRPRTNPFRQVGTNDFFCAPKGSGDSGGGQCRHQYLTGIEGDSITLQLKQTGVTYVTWEFCHHGDMRNYIAKIDQGGSFIIEEPTYNGRLSSTPDLSLTISRLTMEDQRIYNADVFDRDKHYRCDQRYNLTVIKRAQRGENPDVSIPCRSKDGDGPPETDKPKVEQVPKSFAFLTVLRLAFSVCILLFALSLVIYHVKTEVAKAKGAMPSRDLRENEGQYQNDLYLPSLPQYQNDLYWESLPQYRNRP